MTASSDNPTLWIKKFEVDLTSASPNLYGNGRQQSQIRLTIELQAGQDPLTEAQFNSLKLVLEDDRGNYQILPFDGPGALGWWQTPNRDLDYDLMPGSAVPPSSETDTALRASKTMYVSTTVAGGSNVKLRAMIQRSEGVVYYTDTQSGKDSYVTLTTITPPRFGEGDYEWAKSFDEGSISNVFVHEYRLRLKGIGLSPNSVEKQPGMVRWHRNEEGETYATYVGMAYPGADKTVHYEKAIETGAFTPVPLARSSGNDSLLLVLNGADTLRFYRGGLQYGGPCVVTVIDRHGNEHDITFAFSNTGDPLARRTTIDVSYS